MTLLEKAIEIALDGHRGQVDKSGEPYILHPLRVMGAFRDETHRIVGVLHDVLEDTRYGLDDLAANGFSGEICTALVALTRRPEESYEDFVARAAANAISARVKIADIRDNLSRIENLPEAEQQRLGRRYEAALRVLRAVA